MIINNCYFLLSTNLFLFYLKNTIMDATPQKILKILKVQQNRGKKLSMKDLTYQTLLGKIKLAFQIKINHQYYHLYYFDEKERKITINCPEDYQIFAQSQYEKKLYLCKTTKSILSMTNYKSNKEENQEEMQIQTVVNEKKQNLQEKLIQFRKQLRVKVRNILKQRISDISKKYLQKDQYQSVHSSQKCNNCKSDKLITGTLYKCVLCQFSLCHRCQQSVQHPHPYFKIVLKTQKIPNTQYQLTYGSKDISEEKQVQNSKLAVQFAALVECDSAKAQKLINKYPKASIEELVQKYYNGQLPN